MKPMEDQSVIVIGAGLAGLTAAYRLVAAGREVTVLEASDHVGGRALTDSESWADDQYADFGGELVDESYHAFKALAAELDIELSDRLELSQEEEDDRTAVEGYLRAGRFVYEGALVSQDDKFAAIDVIREAFDAHPPEPHEIIEQWVQRARLRGFPAAAVRSVTSMLDQLDSWDSDMHYVIDSHSRGFRRVKGGTQRLAQALADRLDVKLNSRVTKVERHGGVRVHTASGEMYSASRVVCATNMYATITIGFEPPLPEEKTMAIQSLLPAMGGKVLAQYAEGDKVREAMSHVVYGDGHFNSAWASSPHIESGPAVVTGFLSGVNRHLLTDESAALAALDEFVSTAVGHPVTRLHGVVHNWWADPAFMAITVTPPETIRQQIASMVGAFEQRTHIAGDYTDSTMCGTLEGAVRSGIRAADEVLRIPERFNLNDIEAKLVRS